MIQIKMLRLVHVLICLPDSDTLERCLIQVPLPTRLRTLMKRSIDIYCQRAMSTDLVGIRKI